MLVLVLIVLNIPVFLLIGWLMFDTGTSFLQVVVAILKAILIPWRIRVMLDMEDEGEETWRVAAFFIAWALIIYGEYEAIEAVFA